ncbi:MAG: FtsQ-type POTRA domain-containing protein [Acidimicrobiia bacterium]
MASKPIRRVPRWVYVLGGLIGVVGVCAGAIYSPLLDVDSVVAVPTSHLSEKDLVMAAGMHTGEPMMFADTAAAAARVRALPWVKSAHVSPAWPGTLRIVVSERIPVASIEREPGRYAIVDDTGQVVADDAHPVNPLLSGFGDVPSPGGMIEVPEVARVARELAGSALLAGTLSVTTDSRRIRSYTTTMPSGIEIRMGGARDIKRKARIATAIMQRLPNETQYIDVSTPAHPVSGTGRSPTEVTPGSTDPSQK